MATELDESTITTTYELACTDCTFETTVDGGADDVLDVAKAHEETYGEPGRDHFVNCELRQRDE